MDTTVKDCDEFVKLKTQISIANTDLTTTNGAVTLTYGEAYAGGATANYELIVEPAVSLTVESAGALNVVNTNGSVPITVYKRVKLQILYDSDNSK